MKLCGIFLLLALVLWTGNSYGYGVGTTGGQFLKMGIGGRGNGIGAYTGVANDVESIYWNPSGLTKIEKKNAEAILMYSRWFEGIQYGTICIASRQEFGTLGMEILYLTTDDIQGTDIDDNITNTFRGQDILVGLAYAMPIMKKLSLGITTKFIYQKLEEEKAIGFAGDVGGTYDINEDLSVGATVQNVGTRIKFVDEADPMPMVIRIGVGYKIIPNILLLATDVNVPFDNSINVHIGGEYTLFEILSLRLGYRTDTKGLNWLAGISTGIGIRLKLSSRDYYGVNRLGIDYVFVPYADLGITHRFSLGLRF